MKKFEIIIIIISCSSCILCSVLPYTIGFLLQGSDMPSGDFINVFGIIAIFLIGFVPLICGLIGLATGSIILYRNRKLLLDNYHPLFFSIAVILCVIIGFAFAIVSCKLMTPGYDLGLFDFLDYIDLIIDLLL